MIEGAFTPVRRLATRHNCQVHCVHPYLYPHARSRQPVPQVCLLFTSAPLTHALRFWPQYHALPNPPAGFLRGFFAAGILAITFLLWGYLSSHFFTAPICTAFPASFSVVLLFLIGFRYWPLCFVADRKSTRLNSSHVAISYAVFCL